MTAGVKHPFPALTGAVCPLPLSLSPSFAAWFLASAKDPPDVLGRQKCLDALAALRHAKWFQVGKPFQPYVCDALYRSFSLFHSHFVPITGNVLTSEGKQKTWGWKV